MHNAKKYYQAFKQQARRLLPEGEERVCRTSPEDQEREINKLKAGSHLERFFFIYNNETFETERVYNTEKILGHAAANFTMSKYMSLIHPAHQVAQLNYALPLMESLMAGHWKLHGASHYFTGNIALKTAAGEWFLFKRTSYPFRVSTAYKLLAFVCEFTYLNPYQHEPYFGRFTDAAGNLIDWKKILAHKGDKGKKTSLPFSPREKELLQYTAAHKKLSNAEAAVLMEVKENSIKTFKKRIMEKAIDYYAVNFINTRHVALYLKDEGEI